MPNKALSPNQSPERPKTILSEIAKIFGDWRIMAQSLSRKVAKYQLPKNCHQTAFWRELARIWPIILEIWKYSNDVFLKRKIRGISSRAKLRTRREMKRCLKFYFESFKKITLSLSREGGKMRPQGDLNYYQYKVI